MNKFNLYRKKNMINYLLIFITVIWTVIWQIILKIWQKTLYFPKSFIFDEIIKFIINNLFNIYFILSLSFSLIAALSWSLVIQKMNLSIAYPFMSLSYVLVFLASYVIFKESISVYQIIWIIFIIIWVILISVKQI